MGLSAEVIYFSNQVRSYIVWWYFDLELKNLIYTFLYTNLVFIYFVSFIMDSFGLLNESLIKLYVFWLITKLFKIL